ncbi:MAG TPA: DNA repair protein RecO [Chitinophagaceae bacterium]|nr:DNA repair protein RecO [Chitinophagaceae bacterium]
MIYTTNGIVLRTVKYGETSVVVSTLTALFGMQSYIVNGVRTHGKNSKAHFFHPASLLEMQVYHNELKNLQRIKEVKWSYLYQQVFSDIIKNSVALYMVELLQKSIRQPETNEDLFNFSEDAFIQLDAASPEVTANFPIYFALRLAQLLGLSISDNHSTQSKIFSVAEGKFVSNTLTGEPVVNEQVSFSISHLLKAVHPSELDEIRLNKTIRKAILATMENYYQYHIAEFGSMKTLPVLHELMG